MVSQTRARANRNGEAATKAAAAKVAAPQENPLITELHQAPPLAPPQENPLLTNQPPPASPQPQAPQRNWEAEAKRLDSEAKFWKKKYIEQMINHTQVTAALAQPFLAEDAMAQLTTGNPELAAKLAELQAQQG